MDLLNITMSKNDHVVSEPSDVIVQVRTPVFVQVYLLNAMKINKINYGLDEMNLI